MRTFIYAAGLLGLTGIMGYLDRRYFDFLSLGALALLVIPIIETIRRA